MSPPEPTPATTSTTTTSTTPPTTSPTSPTGEQWTIEHGRQRVVVCEVGATLRAYTVGDRPVVDGFGPGEWSHSGRGQVLAPWPNRLSEGRYKFNGVRAQAALDATLGGSFEQLALLFSEPPMAKSLRRLVKLPGIADAYAQDLVARSVRRAIGDLACRDDQVIAIALAGRTTEPLLCALTVTITCRAPGLPLMAVAPPGTVAVPGYPATALDDESGPWQRAFPAARELGADTSVFFAEIANNGLRVPASWLTHGGWAPLWTRAHR